MTDAAVFCTVMALAALIEFAWYRRAKHKRAVERYRREINWNR